MLILLAPLALAPSPIRFVALLAIPGLWAGRWLLKRHVAQAHLQKLRLEIHFLSSTAFDWSVLLLAFMVLVSLYPTYDLVVSLPKIAGIIFGIGVFYSIAGWSERPQGWWWSLVVFLMIGTGLGLLGLLGTDWISKIPLFAPIIARLPLYITGLPGAEAGFHPNEVAGALLWVLPPLIVVALVMGWKRKTFRTAVGRWQYTGLMFIAVVAALIVMGTFVLTQSRSGYLAAAITMLATGLSWLWQRNRWQFILGVTVLTIAWAVFATSFDRILGSLYESADLESDPALSLDTLNGRLEIWSRALYGLQDFPFTGMGMNTFRHLVHVLYPLFLISPDYDIAHAHNEFLQAGLDLGIPGLIAFVGLYIGAFWMVADIWRKRERRLEVSEQQTVLNTPSVQAAIALGLGGGLFAHLIYGLTDAVALGAKPGILFWMLLGLIAGLHHQVTSPLAERQSNGITAQPPITESVTC